MTSTEVSTLCSYPLDLVSACELSEQGVYLQGEHNAPTENLAYYFPDEPEDLTRLALTHYEHEPLDTSVLHSKPLY